MRLCQWPWWVAASFDVKWRERLYSKIRNYSYHIWRDWNERNHDGKVKDELQIIKSIKGDVRGRIVNGIKMNSILKNNLWCIRGLQYPVFKIWVLTHTVARLFVVVV